MLQSHAASLLTLPYVLSQTAANVWLPEAKSCDRKQTQITHALCSVTSSPPTVCFIPANPHAPLNKRGGPGWGILFVCWRELFCGVSKIKTLTARASLLNCLPPLALGFLVEQRCTVVNQMDPCWDEIWHFGVKSGQHVESNTSNVMIISRATFGFADSLFLDDAL